MDALTLHNTVRLIYKEKKEEKANLILANEFLIFMNNIHVAYLSGKSLIYSVHLYED